jgi:hypothetical protein
MGQLRYGIMTNSSKSDSAETCRNLLVADHYTYTKLGLSHKLKSFKLAPVKSDKGLTYFLD